MTRDFLANQSDGETQLDWSDFGVRFWSSDSVEKRVRRPRAQGSPLGSVQWDSKNNRMVLICVIRALYPEGVPVMMVDIYSYNE